MSQITYTDKETLNAQPSIADKNKVTASDMNSIKTAVNDNDSRITTNTTNIANITGTLLWTNSSPTSSFSQQILTIPELVNYDEFEIFFYDNTSRKAVSSTKLLKNNGTNLMTIFQLNDHGNVGNRNIIWNTTTKLQVNDAVTIVVNDAFSRTANNSWCVPIYIVGYKTGLFS